MARARDEYDAPLQWFETPCAIQRKLSATVTISKEVPQALWDQGMLVSEALLAGLSPAIHRSPYWNPLRDGLIGASQNAGD